MVWVGLLPRRRTIKPGHIITKTPGLYASAIYEAKRQNWVLTAGEIPPNDTKYLFTDADPTANFKELAVLLQRSDKESVVSYLATITNLRKKGAKNNTLPAMEVLPLAERTKEEKVTLVMAYCRESEERHVAVNRVLEMLEELNPMPKLVFVELLLPGTQKDIKLVDKIHLLGGCYVPLEGREEHRHLFHKEDLYNYAVKALYLSDYIVFLDADTYPVDSTWIISVKMKLEECGDDYIIQPWGEVVDTQDISLSGSSMSKQVVTEGGKRLLHSHPGLCVAMTRTCFDSIDGFPTTCPCGAGDVMLMLEVSGKECDDTMVREFSYFMDGVRHGIPTKKIDYVDSKMVHVWHGDKTTRGYKMNHELLQSFYPFPTGLLGVDDLGLLRICVGSELQQCLAQRKKIVTLADLDAVINRNA